MLRLPLELVPVSTAQYFEARESFNVMTILKNPMYLLVIMTVVMAFIAPKLIEGMDPEELKAMQENMGNQPTMQDILSGKAFEEKKQEIKSQRKRASEKE